MQIASTGWGDPAVLVTLITAALLILGLVMILSASSVTSFATYGSSFRYFQKQLIWAAFGVVAFVAFARFDYKRLRGVGYIAVVVTALLLLAVLIPGVGITAGGSSRWLGFGALSFQPSEVAKLALILFAADVFSRKDERTLKEFLHSMIPVVPMIGLLAMLIMLQPDLGTTVLVGFIGIGVMFVAGMPLIYLIPVVGTGTALATGVAMLKPYMRARLLVFMHPWADPLGKGYQTIQSLIAMGSGGFLGVGLGASRQKWAYVPNAHTDFIYAILGEEMGLLGTLVVLGMFAFLAYLGIKVARRAPDRFGMLVASGITVWVTLQALINMGAVSGALPVTGVPLPLVSFGGSSLVITLVGMGILTNIATQSRRRLPKSNDAKS
ncbi:MAG TPA: putative lipid II flippase FtsW [Actinomycetota bacterium]|nr:putative lipid II flippase FtsW [Actinomycetota bacterium]